MEPEILIVDVLTIKEEDCTPEFAALLIARGLVLREVSRRDAQGDQETSQALMDLLNKRLSFWGVKKLKEVKK